jgi:hypothetical protein
VSSHPSIFRLGVCGLSGGVGVVIRCKSFSEVGGRSSSGSKIQYQSLSSISIRDSNINQLVCLAPMLECLKMLLYSLLHPVVLVEVYDSAVSFASDI